jgi:hypothetical protein
LKPVSILKIQGQMHHWDLKGPMDPMDPKGQMGRMDLLL